MRSCKYEGIHKTARKNTSITGKHSDTVSSHNIGCVNGSMT